MALHQGSREDQSSKFNRRDCGQMGAAPYSPTCRVVSAGVQGGEEGLAVKEWMDLYWGAVHREGISDELRGPQRQGRSRLPSLFV